MDFRSPQKDNSADTNRLTISRDMSKNSHGITILLTMINETVYKNIVDNKVDIFFYFTDYSYF